MRQKDYIKVLQSALNAKGVTPPLAIDGDFGPKTQAASDGFNIEVVLFPIIHDVRPSEISRMTPIEWARTQLGQKEIKGVKDNPIIAEYHSHSGNLKGYQPDEVAWCSSFLNAAADYTGYEKTNNALAISWKNYGEDTGDWVDEGDIVLLSSSVGSGHVTLANKAFSRSRNKTFEGLGGNQADSVCISVFSTARIVTTRRWVKWQQLKQS